MVPRVRCSGGYLPANRGDLSDFDFDRLSLFKGLGYCEPYVLS